jgi:hypothetical protein
MDGYHEYRSLYRRMSPPHQHPSTWHSDLLGATEHEATHLGAEFFHGLCVVTESLYVGLHVRWSRTWARQDIADH